MTDITSSNLSSLPQNIQDRVAAHVAAGASVQVNLQTWDIYVRYPMEFTAPTEPPAA